MASVAAVHVSYLKVDKIVYVCPRFSGYPHFDLKCREIENFTELAQNAKVG